MHVLCQTRRDVEFENELSRKTKDAQGLGILNVEGHPNYKASHKPRRQLTNLNSFQSNHHKSFKLIDLESVYKNRRMSLKLTNLLSLCNNEY